MQKPCANATLFASAKQRGERGSDFKVHNVYARSQIQLQVACKYFALMTKTIRSMTAPKTMNSPLIRSKRTQTISTSCQTKRGVCLHILRTQRQRRGQAVDRHTSAYVLVFSRGAHIPPCASRLRPSCLTMEHYQAMHKNKARPLRAELHTQMW